MARNVGRRLRRALVRMVMGGPAIFASVGADAAVTVSSAPTANMSCTDGVCTPTAADAVLNASDLTGMLATGDVTVVADGAALDIDIEAPLGWSNGHGLTLDSYRSIAVGRPLAIAGGGGLTLITNDGGAGGDFSFGRHGGAKFRNATGSLIINGARYALVQDIDTLANAIAAHPGLNYALANDIDASAEHFSRTPILTDFSGIFEGLGNTISNFNIYDTVDSSVALFKAVVQKGMVRDVTIANANVTSENSFFQEVAPLVAYNSGTVLQCAASGTVRSDFWVTAGGLVAENYGTIARSFAAVEVSGVNDAEVGGLVGNAHGHVHDVYATGHVIAGDEADVGGLIGYNLSKLSNSYATGSVSGGQNAVVGGLIGENLVRTSDGYWDTTTGGAPAGIGDGKGRATGLTSAELQSGLPAGFDPTIWGLRKTANSGFPYLLSTPPK